MIDDVKGVVPEDFWKKHLSTSMRQRPFHTVMDGSAFTFHVFCKVDACLSPKDLTKVKENLASYAQELAKDPRLFGSEIMEKLMKATYEKQVEGMGKYKFNNSLN